MPERYLRADVVTLSVQRRRVVDDEEDLEQFAQADARRVERDADHLGMAGVASADLLVGRRIGVAVAVAGLDRGHAVDQQIKPPPGTRSQPPPRVIVSVVAELMVQAPECREGQQPGCRGWPRRRQSKTRRACAGRVGWKLFEAGRVPGRDADAARGLSAAWFPCRSRACVPWDRT